MTSRQNSHPHSEPDAIRATLARQEVTEADVTYKDDPGLAAAFKGIFDKDPALGLPSLMQLTLLVQTLERLAPERIKNVGAALFADPDIHPVALEKWLSVLCHNGRVAPEQTPSVILLHQALGCSRLSLDLRGNILHGIEKLNPSAQAAFYDDFLRVMREPAMVGKVHDSLRERPHVALELRADTFAKLPETVVTEVVIQQSHLSLKSRSEAELIAEKIAVCTGAIALGLLCRFERSGIEYHDLLIPLRDHPDAVVNNAIKAVLQDSKAPELLLATYRVRAGAVTLAHRTGTDYQTALCAVRNSADERVIQCSLGVIGEYWIEAVTDLAPAITLLGARAPHLLFEVRPLRYVGSYDARCKQICSTLSEVDVHAFLDSVSSSIRDPKHDMTIFLRPLLPALLPGSLRELCAVIRRGAHGDVQAIYELKEEYMGRLSSREKSTLLDAVRTWNSRSTYEETSCERIAEYLSR